MLGKRYIKVATEATLDHMAHCLHSSIHGETLSNNLSIPDYFCNRDQKPCRLYTVGACSVFEQFPESFNK